MYLEKISDKRPQEPHILLKDYSKLSLLSSYFEVLCFLSLLSLLFIIISSSQPTPGMPIETNDEPCDHIFRFSRISKSPSPKSDVSHRTRPSTAPTDLRLSGTRSSSRRWRTCTRKWRENLNFSSRTSTQGIRLRLTCLK